MDVMEHTSSYVLPSEYILLPLGSKFDDDVFKDVLSKASTETPHCLISDSLGPIDVSSRSTMDDGLGAYMSYRKLSPNRKHLESAIKTVRSIFVEHYGQHIKPVSVSRGLDILPSGSAGFPFVQGTKKGEVRNLVSSCWRRVRENKKILVPPCTADCVRANHRVGENKPGLIWAYPGYLNVLELQFAAHFLQSKPDFIGLSFDGLDHGSSLDRFNRRISQGHRCINLEFSSFHANVSAELIRKAFDIICSCMELSEVENRLLHQLKTYFIRTPLVYYDKMVYKTRGIPSGSCFSLLVSNIVNMIGCYYASYVNPQVIISHESSQWLGDKSFLSIVGTCSAEDIKTRYLQSFKELGIHINESNTSIVSINQEAPVSKFLGPEIRVSKTLAPEEKVVENILKKLLSVNCCDSSHTELDLECSITGKMPPYLDISKITRWVEENFGKIPKNERKYVELELKFGTLLDKKEHRRIDVKDLTKCVFTHNSNTRFDMGVDEADWEGMCKLLEDMEKSYQETNSKGEKLKSKCMFNISRSDLTDSILLVKQSNGETKKIRISKDNQSTPPRFTAINKLRISDLFIHNPSSVYDLRLSLSYETPYEENNLEEILIRNKPDVTRIKKRSSWSHVPSATKFDMTRVLQRKSRRKLTKNSLSKIEILKLSLKFTFLSYFQVMTNLYLVKIQVHLPNWLKFL